MEPTSLTLFSTIRSLKRERALNRFKHFSSPNNLKRHGKLTWKFKPKFYNPLLWVVQPTIMSYITHYYGSYNSLLWVIKYILRNQEI